MAKVSSFQKRKLLNSPHWEMYLLWVQNGWSVETIIMRAQLDYGEKLSRATLVHVIEEHDIKPVSILIDEYNIQQKLTKRLERINKQLFEENETMLNTRPGGFDADQRALSKAFDTNSDRLQAAVKQLKAMRMVLNPSHGGTDPSVSVQNATMVDQNDMTIPSSIPETWETK